MDKLNTSKTTSKATEKITEERTFSSFGSAQPRKVEGSNARNSTSGNNQKLNSSGNTWNNPWKASGTRK